MVKLNNGEKIHLIKRRHIFILILELLPFFFFSFALILAVIILPFFVEEPSWLSLVYEFVGEFNFWYFIYFICSVFIFVFWLVGIFLVSSYYLDCWAVTNQRTIHTELKGMFNRYMASIYHHRIQDVSVDIGGILKTYLNFGNLQIQTAGKFREFLFKQIADPYETKEVIMRAQKEFLKKRGRSNISTD